MTSTACKETQHKVLKPQVRWETVCCNYCGRDDTKIFHREKLPYFGTIFEFTIVKCRYCGLVYTNPRLTEHNATYLLDASVDPASIESHARAKKPVFDSALDEIESLLKPALEPQQSKLLDIGCGSGHFLHAVRERGFDVAGVEPAEASANYAIEKFAVPVYQQDVYEMDIPPESYDVVTAWDVIEHVQDPKRFLQCVSRWLKPDGILALRFPSAAWQKIKGVILHQILHSNWPSFGATMHLYFFSEATITKMAQLAEIEIIRTKTTLSEANSQNIFIDQIKKASRSAIRSIELCSGKKLGNLEVYGRKSKQEKIN
jgi:2-polyprenyl-3-methyl-5-hydroxy-6-metoxy-1,4-benzoquinol methylase